MASAAAAISNFRKTKGEQTGLLVDAASDVVVIQKGMLDTMAARLAETEKRLADLWTLQQEVENLRLELDRVHRENRQLKDENAHLKRRIKALEDNSSG